MRLYTAISIILLSIVFQIKAAATGLSDDTSDSNNIIEKSEQDDDQFIWMYPLEYYKDGFTPLIIEETIDERLSNANFFYIQRDLFDKNVHIMKSTNRDIIEEYGRFINGPDVDQSKCTEHLQQMVDLLGELEITNERLRRNISGNVVEATTDSVPKIDARHIRLAKVLDSYGRYSSGMMEEKKDVLGSTVECLETKLQFDPDRASDLIGTRSCLAKLDMKQHVTPQLKKYHSQSLAAISVEICIPNTCHANSLARNKHLIQKLIDSQFVMPESVYVHQHRQVVDLFCINDHNEDIGIPTSGKALLVLLTCWIAAMIYVTLRNDRSSILDNYFNIKHSIDALISQSDATRGDGINFDAFSWVKVLSSLYVVYGHTLMASLTLSQDLGRVARIVDTGSSMYLQLFMLPSLFFIISGTITTHIALIKIQTLNRSLNWQAQIIVCLRMIIARYLRLVPCYFLLFWFKKSVYLYTLYGFILDRGYNEHTLYGGCKSESWLTPLLGQAAYLPLTAQCMPHAWSLACETLFILVGAPIIVLLSKRPKVGLGLTTLLIAASIWSMFSNYRAIDQNQLRYIGRFFTYTVVDTMSTHSTIHTKSQNRIGTYLVGVIAGYILHRYRWEQTKRWPRWFSKHATRLALIIFSLPTIMGLFRQQILPHLSMNLTLIFNVLIFSQIIWPLSVIILTIRMMTDWKSSYFMQLLLGNFWRTMGKIGLGVLLVHTDLIYLAIAQAPSLPYSNSSLNFGSIYLSTILLSLVVYVLFESPLERMVKDLLHRFDKLFAGTSVADEDTKSNKID